MAKRMQRVGWPVYGWAGLLYWAETRAEQARVVAAFARRYPGDVLFTADRCSLEDARAGRTRARLPQRALLAALGLVAARGGSITLLGVCEIIPCEAKACATIDGATWVP